ncbi:unnamed protein product [Rhodiola kirilowii]
MASRTVWPISPRTKSTAVPCTLGILAPLDLLSNGTTHEGEKKSTKCIIEVDDGKYKVVYKIIGGDFSEEYNNFHVMYDAIPKPEDGDHNIVHWIFEYEKPDENTPDPTSLLEYLCGVTKDIDAHIQQEAAAAK